MNWYVRFFLVFSFLVPFSNLGLADESGSDLETPGGVWWHKKSRITIEGALVLEGPLRLIADEVVVKAPITTQGHALDIDARKIVFDTDGRIDAFTAPATETGAIPPGHETAADTGGPDGGTGATGASGKKGFTGRPGMGAAGPSPSEISVFTADLEGTPIMNGTGQQGGQGGRGGRGQRGGTGGKGTAGVAAWTAALFGHKEAGKGGRGGEYGKGGQGGDGGPGGSPVPVSWLMARDWLQNESQQIISAPNRGGIPGEPGIPGDLAEGGPGGDGATSRFLFFSDDVKAGPSGDVGASWAQEKMQATDGYGAPGPDGINPPSDFWKQNIGREFPLFVATFPDFEAERFKVTTAWFEYHWWRLFELVTRSSLDLLLPDEAQEVETPLAHLLAGELEPANLDVVAERWNKTFVTPLRFRLAECEPLNSPKCHTLREVLSIAEPYTTSLISARKRGALVPSELAVLKTSVESATKRRSELSHNAVQSCADYVGNVLSHDRYKRYLLTRSEYFEIPVCRAAQEFLSETGVQLPIQLATGFVPPEGIESIAGIKVERLAAADLQGQKTSWFKSRVLPWFANVLHALEGLLIPTSLAGSRADFVLVPIRPALLSETQLREFLPKPSQSSVVGSVGLHQGYVYPKKQVTIEELDRFLKALVRMR